MGFHHLCLSMVGQADQSARQGNPIETAHVYALIITIITLSLLSHASKKILRSVLNGVSRKTNFG